ncbi:DUF6502 family protein [uncultured Thiothrix sp.]|uniref:DUF6502 family protein n=1 Tax=uncultured Thiothrix sp. TaxID=223185 RepID=UPI00261CC82C|nr:DUF6502 family protein [uncultured Thiothrix sp.]
MNTTLHQIVLHILRPLIRILHRKGLAFGEFSLLARKVYVEIAEEALTQAEEKPTSSRIAISTGLTRKEVAQLRQHDAETLVDVARYNRSVRVIGGWINDPDFNTPTGQPATLVLQGPLPSFETLVGRYSGDMPCRAMLRELLQTGVVSQASDDSVTLLTDAYIPQGSETEKLSILATDVALLVNTINHNLLCEAEERRFQRKVSYDNLPAEALPQFKQMVNEDAMALLLKLNAWLAQQDRDHNPQVSGSGRMRAGLGIYYFEEPVQSSSAQQDKQDEV